MGYCNALFRWPNYFALIASRVKTKLICIPNASWFVEATLFDQEIPVMCIPLIGYTFIALERFNSRVAMICAFLYLKALYQPLNGIIVTPIVGVCICSLFCCTLLYVPSSLAIILMGKRDLVALLSLSSLVRNYNAPLKLRKT